MNRRRLLTLAALPLLRARAAAPDALTTLLETIRARHNVPALTAGLITTAGLAESAATGLRKAGGSTAATNSDLWHYGSMTKAMTATLLARFVAAGRLRWDAALEELLPDLLKGAVPEAKAITLRQLLTHRSGLPANAKNWGLVTAGNRAELVRVTVAQKPLHDPGTAYLYSNLGYMVAGVVAERLGKQVWEFSIQRRLFTPLGMKMGFGGTGTEGKEDQPWPHGENGQPMPNNGPMMDNPPALGPAGTCHGTLANYAKFVADHLRGAAKGKALLPHTLYTDLHTPQPGTDYALGWHIAQRDWAGGTVLTHNGTNTMNFSVVWMAPLKGFAVVACCNQGGPKATAACDEACSALIARRVAAP